MRLGLAKSYELVELTALNEAELRHIMNDEHY